MQNARKGIRSYRAEYLKITAAPLFTWFFLIISACSTSQSEKEQALHQATAVQGDAIDAPPASSTASTNSEKTRKPEELSAPNLYAAAENIAGQKPNEQNPVAVPSSQAAKTPSSTAETVLAQSPASGKQSSAAVTPEKENPAAESPAAMASPTVARAAGAASPPSVPGSSYNSGYQRITLGLLGSFRYEYPDPTYIESEEDPSKLKLKDQFPPNIKALHGKKISIMGYIMPIDVDEEWRVKTFTLVRDQMVCCFGNVPEINEWVYVRLNTPQRADQLIDVPVIVFGTLEVGEEIKFGTLANVYRVEADRVSTNY
ncbi:MAG: DUF3299 domain-containing protein [bacterium]